MSLSSKDVIVLFIALCLIGSAAFGLYTDFSRTGKGSGEQIGTVVFKKKKAERMFSGTSEWEYVDQNVPVFNNDSLRTSQGSSAVIHLKDGSNIDLDENTLIKIALTGAEAVVDFSGGAVYASKGGDSSSLKLKSGTTSVNVSTGAMSVSKKEDKDLSVNVSSGSAQLSVAGKTVQVRENQVAMVSGSVADVKAQTISLLSPQPGAFVPVDKGAKLQVTFSWKSASTAATLQVSQDRTFSKTVASARANASHKVSLPSGDYFWRVREAGGESEVRKISVVDDTPVLPVSPARNEAISYISHMPSVNFRWESSRIASSYEIEVSQDPLFAKKAVSLDVKLPSITVDTLEEGTYYWRVRPMYPSGGVGEFRGQAVKFMVVRARGVDTPMPVYPPNGFEKSMSATAVTGITLSWRNLPEAKDYTVEISKDKKFSTIDATASVRENQYTVKNLAEGVYQWRVKASGLVGVDSQYCEPLTFSVVKDMPLLIVSATEDSSGAFVLVWKDQSDFGSYKVEVAKDKDFTSIVKSEKAQRQRLILKDMDLGAWFWRVAALDQAGKEVIRSSVGEFSVSEIIDAPAVVSPSNNKEVDVSKVKKIVFEWKKAKGASEYELEIFKYGLSSDKMMYSTTAKAEKFELSDFSVLSSGKFFWQIRAVRKSSSGVAAKSKPSKGYFVISAGPEISAPKIGTIKVYVE